MNEDPIGLGGDPGNLYRYVGNAPTSYIDPDGLIQRAGQEQMPQIPRGEPRPIPRSPAPPPTLPNPKVPLPPMPGPIYTPPWDFKGDSGMCGNPWPANFPPSPPPRAYPPLLVWGWPDDPKGEGWHHPWTDPPRWYPNPKLPPQDRPWNPTPPILKPASPKEKPSWRS